jgi:hypothetical protein
LVGVGLLVAFIVKHTHLKFQIKVVCHTTVLAAAAAAAATAAACFSLLLALCV